MKTALENTFELEDQIMVASVKTTQVLFQEENGADAVALYFFYYQTAKRQKTNQVRATQAYCEKGLHWGDKRFREAKAILEKHHLVELIKSSDRWYIRLNYIKRNINSPQNRVVDIEPNSPQKEVLAFRGTEVLKENKDSLNAFTSPNGEGGSVLKKPPSCPLDLKIPKALSTRPIETRPSISIPLTSLQIKYPNGHKECVEYLTSEEEDRGQKFINRSKQFACIHKILQAGYDFGQMDKTIRLVEKKFGKGSWDYATLASWLEKGSTYIGSTQKWNGFTKGVAAHAQEV